MVEYFTCITFSGRSVATWVLSLRSTIGVMMAWSFVALAVSFFFSMFCQNCLLNTPCLPNNHLLIKFICDHRSRVPFSTGVPVSVRRCWQESIFTAFVIILLGFLIACDSSKMM